MPRPFAVIGISFFLTLAVLSQLNDKFIYVLLAVSVISGIITISFEKFRSPAVFSFAAVSVLAACLLFCFVNDYLYKPAVSLDGTDAEFSGKIIRVDQPEPGTTRYLIKTEQINGEPVNLKIRLSSSELIDARLYDSVFVQAKLFMLGGNSQDSRRFYKSAGVYLGAYTDAEPVLVPNKNKPLLYYIQMTRQTLIGSLNQLLPNENGGLIAALLFGDKTYLSEKTVSDFRDIGVSHIMAVSGLHLTVFLFAFLYLVEKVQIKKRLASLLAVVFVLFFMAITGFSASVLRAGFMLLVIQVGKTLNREADSLNSLGLSVLLITAFNPFAAGDVGLQLSIFATIGIVTSQKLLKSPFEKSLNNINSPFLRKPVIFLLDSLVITVSASIFTFPIILISFGRFSLISVLSNILLLYLSTPAMIFGALCAILFSLPLLSVIAYPLSIIAGILSGFMLTISRMLSNIPFASIHIGDKYIYIWFSLALLMFAYAVIAGKKNKKNYLAITFALCTLVLTAGVLSNVLINRSTVAISVMDIGNSSSALITNKTNAALIACGGDRFSSQAVIDGLEAKDVDSLDLLLIPRTEPTESGAVLDVINIYQAEKIIVPEINYDLDYLTEIPGKEISKQTDTVLWEKVRLNYLYDEEFCCAHADISGTGILFMFYPGSDYSRIPDAWLNSEILICRSKPPFDCDELKFTTVIVSSDEPISESVLRKYRTKGIELFTTAGLGNITVTTQGSAVYSVRRGD